MALTSFIYGFIVHKGYLPIINEVVKVIHIDKKFTFNPHYNDMFNIPGTRDMILWGHRVNDEISHGQGSWMKASVDIDIAPEILTYVDIIALHVDGINIALYEFIELV